MCTSNPCENGATCELKDDSYKCKCLAGYIGTHCEGKYGLRFCTVWNIPFRMSLTISLFRSRTYTFVINTAVNTTCQ